MLTNGAFAFVNIPNLNEYIFITHNIRNIHNIQKQIQYIANANNQGAANPLYGAHGGFISPEAQALQNESSIGISDQIAQDAQGFQDVLVKSQIPNDMIKVCLDTTNQTVSNDFLKNTFVTLKFLCMEEVKKWDKNNIDYFVNNTGILQLITGKWYKMRDEFNQSIFHYTFQTVHSACFLMRGLLTTMSRNLTVSEEEKVNEFVRFLSQGQRNDVSPDVVKQLQDGWNWKQKRAKMPQQQQKQQKKGKQNNNNNNNKRGQQRPQQKQQKQQQQQRQQNNKNQKGSNKDDCCIM